MKLCNTIKVTRHTRRLWKRLLPRHSITNPESLEILLIRYEGVMGCLFRELELSETEINVYKEIYKDHEFDPYYGRCSKAFITRVEFFLKTSTVIHNLLSKAAIRDKIYLRHPLPGDPNAYIDAMYISPSDFLDKAKALASVQRAAIFAMIEQERS